MKIIDNHISDILDYAIDQKLTIPSSHKLNVRNFSLNILM